MNGTSNGFGVSNDVTMKGIDGIELIVDVSESDNNSCRDIHRSCSSGGGGGGDSLNPPRTLHIGQNYPQHLSKVRSSNCSLNNSMLTPQREAIFSTHAASAHQSKGRSLIEDMKLKSPLAAVSRYDNLRTQYPFAITRFKYTVVAYFQVLFLSIFVFNSYSDSSSDTSEDRNHKSHHVVMAATLESSPQRWSLLSRLKRSPASPLVDLLGTPVYIYLVLGTICCWILSS